MTKEIIQFSHANGFPAMTYHTLFTYLRDEFEIQYIDLLGHNQEFPITDNWASTAEELIAELDRKKLGPIIGMGHSLGGSITLFAAIQRPDLFKYLVLLDTPILSFARAKMVQLFKNLGKADWITPGGRALRRKTSWSSYEAMLQYFKNKPLFKNFDEQALHDYVTYGTVVTKEGLQLKFDPRIESQIYMTLPHNYSSFKNKLTVPGVALIGRKSNVVSKSDAKSVEKKFSS